MRFPGAKNLLSRLFTHEPVLHLSTIKDLLSLWLKAKSAVTMLLTQKPQTANEDHGRENEEGKF